MCMDIFNTRVKTRYTGLESGRDIRVWFVAKQRRSSAGGKADQLKERTANDLLGKSKN